MTIGVISDTHSRPIPLQVIDAFRDAEFIIHAGDFCSFKEVKTLLKVRPLKAVWGTRMITKSVKCFRRNRLLTGMVI